MEEGQLQQMVHFSRDSLKEPKVEEARLRLMPDGVILYPMTLSLTGPKTSGSKVSSLRCCQQTVVKVH